MQPIELLDWRSPSKLFADSLPSFVFHDEMDLEQRRKLVNAFILYWEMLERMGWYDHTGDWDFHVGVELNTGEANDHIGDGATVDWKGQAEDLVYSGGDTRDTVIITGPLYVDEADDQREADALKAYRTHTPELDPNTADEATWEIPINKLKSLTFGYCT